MEAENAFSLMSAMLASQAVKDKKLSNEQWWNERFYLTTMQGRSTNSEKRRLRNQAQLVVSEKEAVRLAREAWNSVDFIQEQDEKGKLVTKARRMEGSYSLYLEWCAVIQNKVGTVGKHVISCEG